MNLFKKIYCRVFQTVFYLALPFLPYRKPTVLEDFGQIAEVLKLNKIPRVLLVTDNFLYSSGTTALLERTLNDSGVQAVVYSNVCPNPTVKNVEEGVAEYKSNNCGGLIAFGGGSPMDCAKAIGARIAHPNKTLKQLKGILKVTKKTPLIFAIPTTAGTGSEATLASVITDSEEKHKYVINSFPLIPSYAVLNAQVTVSLPKSLTATTGLDALTHAVEAYIGRSTTKETRENAKKATKLIFENLLTAYNEPTNLTARKNMLTASYLAGLAFTKSYVGYVHAIAHSLGGQYNIPHGLANSVLLSVVLKSYGKSAHKKLYELALFAGIISEKDGCSLEQGAQKFIEKIEFLLKETNIPKGFKEIKEEDISLMATHAEREANPLYPVPKLYGKKQLEDFYYKVLIKD